jgi:hypothetical protein
MLASADEPSVQPAIDAARRREERLKTVTIEWKVTTFVPKGGQKDSGIGGLPVPSADKTVESTHRLVLDGPRYRAEHSDPGMRLRVPGFGDCVLTFDGERSYLRLFPDGPSEPAQLMIERASGTSMFGNTLLLPLAQWCRESLSSPFRDDLGRDRRSLSISEVAGQPHLEIRLAASGDRFTTYHLDPQRDYLLRRVRSESEGTVEVTDVDYRKQPGVGWIPTAWTTTKTRDGEKLVHRIRAEVTAVRFNEPVTPGIFRLDPVPGQTVADNDEHKLYRVRADGNLVEVDGNGMPVTSGSPSQSPSWPGRSLVRYILLPALLGAAVGFIVFRRRRRPHTPST